MNTRLTRVAMATAGTMLAHQVASKAFRDAAFLAAWPATTLPVMMVATAALVVVLVPVFSRFLDRFSPLRVVSAGFALSAAAHLAEWSIYGGGRWIVIVIYLHLAGVSGLLLSGFWSSIAERFDPAGARASYGRIAAAGTVGGVLGSFAAERVAIMLRFDAILILLALLHLLCAVGLLMMRNVPTLLPPQERTQATSGVRELSQSPYLRTLAATVVLTSAASAIADYLLKSHATMALGTGPGLLRFFAVFYGGVQILTFVAQTNSRTLTRWLGIGGTISTLPAGVGAVGAVALLFQGWPSMIALRGVDSVLRGSLFRSGYELLFVPMDPGERHRLKTGLDVTCDRAGEAWGAGFVQLILIAGGTAVTGALLTIVLVLATFSVWLGRRIDRLYLGVVERQLLKYTDAPPVSFVSEAGWTIIQVPNDTAPGRAAAPSSAAAKPLAAQQLDPALRLLVELRSSEPRRVTAALADASNLSRVHVAQIVDLLAWDEVMPAARKVLEPLAPAYVGMLIDALVEPTTDFAIRRRLPRILGTVASARSLDGVVRGLEDPRFEVRYHCSRAIDRILTKNPELSIDRAHMIAIVERELAVPRQVWQGYRLLDVPDLDEPAKADEQVEDSARHLQHIFSLLSTIVAREPLDAAVRGIRSPNAGVRGLAIEYLDQVLPLAVLERLRAMIASTASSGDAPSPSREPPAATRSPRLPLSE